MIIDAVRDNEDHNRMKKEVLRQCIQPNERMRERKHERTRPTGSKPRKNTLVSARIETSSSIWNKLSHSNSE
ncbi:hypothetical protein PM082_024366 [Marasmius tenuissimus]|nr:hypothetical protein PM082_024366 [Marasmius tenuissimus]